MRFTRESFVLVPHIRYVAPACLNERVPISGSCLDMSPGWRRVPGRCRGVLLIVLLVLPFVVFARREQPSSYSGTPRHSPRRTLRRPLDWNSDTSDRPVLYRAYRRLHYPRKGLIQFTPPWDHSLLFNISIPPSIDDPTRNTRSAWNATSGRSFRHFKVNFQLYSVRAGTFLQLLPNGTVGLTANQSDPYTFLKLQPLYKPMKVYTIRIQAVSTGTYLCMNSKGRLYSSCNRSTECEFLSHIAKTYYTTIESKRYSKRYLSIGPDKRIRKSRKLRGKNLIQDHFFMALKIDRRTTDDLLKKIFPSKNGPHQHCANFFPSFTRGRTINSHIFTTTTSVLPETTTTAITTTPTTTSTTTTIPSTTAPKDITKYVQENILNNCRKSKDRKSRRRCRCRLNGRKCKSRVRCKTQKCRDNRKRRRRRRKKKKVKKHGKKVSSSETLSTNFTVGNNPQSRDRSTGSKSNRNRKTSKAKANLSPRKKEYWSQLSSSLQPNNRKSFLYTPHSSSTTNRLSRVNSFNPSGRIDFRPPAPRPPAPRPRAPRPETKLNPLPNLVTQPPFRAPPSPSSKVRHMRHRFLRQRPRGRHNAIHDSQDTV